MRDKTQENSLRSSHREKFGFRDLRENFSFGDKRDFTLP